jgi:hypothetical protein
VAISINNIPYGYSAKSEKSEFKATREIVSDGTVDAAFVTAGESFISSLTDDRVSSFLSDGTAPGAGWKPHELGGFDSDHQSLFVENEKVVLRSNVEENGRKIQHLIQAPFEQPGGKVNLEASTEGYQFVASGNSSVFHIPLG